MMRFLIDIHFVMALDSFRKQPFIRICTLSQYLLISNNIAFLAFYFCSQNLI